MNKKDELNNREIFILQYPVKDGDLFFSSGSIIKRHNIYLFHTASTEKGSSGSHLIERGKINLILSLHKGGQEDKKKNKNVKDTENSDDTKKKRICFI